MGRFLEADESLLEIFPDFAEKIQLCRICLEYIWSMIVNVAARIEGSWVLLHSWLLEIFESKLDILSPTLPQKVHEPNEVIRSRFRRINFQCSLEVLICSIVRLLIPLRSMHML